MMTKAEMAARLATADRELDRADAFRRMGSFDEASERLTGAVRLLHSVLWPVAGAVLPVGPGEAPKAAEAPQDVLQEPVPAPVAIVTDNQVRQFAEEHGRDVAAVRMLLNAAFTIETLSRDVCEGRKEIARLEQEGAARESWGR